ncbi:arginine--tRNA ligase [Bacteroidota bacterium]|nr:arginine--tRNA ligase [Bacteroidota bacterium]MDC3115196.1 arginine--tRNA ligase [Bacteroidota bacterium]MDC3129782.1 arginine--tRNA ligase [Bacteroidota bacterium]MDC3230539.1 arginine--tRNA ligase [Bacteroidota bacterium]
MLNNLKDNIKDIISFKYGIDKNIIEFQKTRKEFEGDLTIVVFPLIRIFKKSPEEICNEIGYLLSKQIIFISSFNVIKGFLNIELNNNFWIESIIKISKTKNYGITKKNNKSDTTLVEFSSPNTNKPLHLGHIRNIVLGDSVSRIIEATGKNVKRVQIINDRGIHICKSMLAWQTFGNGETPEKANMKGDHLVGKYYVKFNQEYNKELAELRSQGYSEDECINKSRLNKEAKELLLRWESNDSEVIKLWSQMNNWVYAGFNETYKKLGVTFDKNYYESETYLLGKDLIEDGLKSNVFYKKEDNSVWIDLTEFGLDEKLLLRSDGTAVYITQDIGTAILRFKDFKFSEMVYTVGNEQNYHFDVLFKILKKLNYSWANMCHHLSYGMVGLPEGKMKSREGTVVDADDLLNHVLYSSIELSNHLNKKNDLSNKDHKVISLAAIKYFLLKVDAKKNMMFNPKESIDFNGNTGPFLLYTYARIKSLIRKNNTKIEIKKVEINSIEKDLIKKIIEYPEVIRDSALSYNPSLICNYIFEMVKIYNRFYQNNEILVDDQLTRSLRLTISEEVSKIIKTSSDLLGFEVLEKM